MAHTRIVAAALSLALIAVTATGCAGVKQTAGQMVQQGIETTSAGPNNVVPANDAQSAVDAVNAAQQQTQQGADNAGQ